MRRIVRSRTFISQLQAMNEFAAVRFGARDAQNKTTIPDRFLKQHLAVNPCTRTFDPRLKIFYYTVSRTPFQVLFDFDDVELRLHCVMRAGADRSRVSLNDVEWE